MPLFESLDLRHETLRNRLCVSPMCQYSSDDGFATDWHLVHLGQFAVGGAAMVLTEATAVTRDGRISPHDLGIYRDEHVEMLGRIARFIDSQGAIPGMQLAHAGRKASTARPWEGGGPVDPAAGGWTPILAPSAIAFADGFPTPRAMDDAEIAVVTRAFVDAALRALAAQMRVIEIHAAHGYLLNEFLSPLSNQRTDRYGGSFENRIRLLVEVVDAVRRVWPEKLPLLLRISASDWHDNGWTVEDSVALAKVVRSHGVDLIDCSSGGVVSGVRVPVGPGYQVPFAERVRRDGGIKTGAVGMITEARQADSIIAEGKADVVFLARQMLRDPHFALHAAKELGADVRWPPQYGRAK